MKLSSKQWRAFHLWMSLIAKDLKDQGKDMRKVLEPTIEITPTTEIVKNCVWRPLQIEKYNIESTKDIDSKQLQAIHLDVDRFFLQEHEINLPFPSRDNYELLKQIAKEYNL
jgi:hypothetical protein